MRILHTSDWHIGKKLNGKTRLDEQRDVLYEIADICDKESVDLVLVAGDVYDTYTPSAEAEELFFETVAHIASPYRAVAVISGNHDDWQRLCASDVLASRANAYVFGGEKTPLCGKPTENADSDNKSGDFVSGDKNATENKKAVYAVRTGKRFCVIKKGDEQIYVGVLPYPSEKRFGEAKDDTPFGEKMSRWIGECFENNTDGLPQILMSHIFMLGGVSTDGERQIDLGGTRAVDRNLIPDNCLYTALGHLHKRQVIDTKRNIIYSGAILEYGFDEAGVEKSVTVFDINNGQVENLHTVPLEKGKKLGRFSALSAEQGETIVAANADVWAELTLYLNEPLSERETKRLISLPNLAELCIERSDYATEQTGEDRRKMDEKTAFIEYYKSRYNCDPPEDLLNAYLSLINGGAL